LLKDENSVDVIETSAIAAAEAIDTKGFRSITRQHELLIIYFTSDIIYSYKSFPSGICYQ